MLICKRPLIALAYRVTYLEIQTPVHLPIFSLLRVCCSLCSLPRRSFPVVPSLIIPSLILYIHLIYHG
jgi:hypothetical protein